ncbi:MAG: response regulator [candidate division NC10 bacterium]|nr:response regulator [candidate division NC10 bacterium]
MEPADMLSDKEPDGTRRGGWGRLLIVEDDPEMRRLLAEFLRGEGFLVDQAADGAEALRRVRQGSFGTVVLDKNLPDGSGLEILRRLRVLIPDTPVILITAFGDARTHEEAFTRGAYDLLLKPFNLDDLLDVLRKAQDYAKEGRPGA